MFIQNLFTSLSKTYTVTDRISPLCNLNHAVWISGFKRFIDKNQIILPFYNYTTVVGSFGELETNRW